MPETIFRTPLAVKKPILILVEHEPLARMRLAEKFRSGGLSVIECATADEAADLVTSEAAFDIIFANANAPGTITGLELARLAREYSIAPVILASADLTAEQAKGLGHVLPTPFEPERAVRMTVRLLGRGTLAEGF